MSMTCTCGCCEGIAIVVPQNTANRPGLPALAGRVGTHATFLETMIARLSSADYPALAALTTRDPADPAIALLDTWALVADVLTFYQERIANEGYLRTATERRSILELARLIGYRLRPGVAATAYLAYTLDEDRSKNPAIPTATLIPAGSRSQSVPGPGQSPQSFETSADLDARSAWNNLQVRQTQPQTETTIRLGSTNDPDVNIPRVYLQGIATNLSVGDALLIDFGPGQPFPFRVVEVIPDAAAGRTRVNLMEWSSVASRMPTLEWVAAILGRYRSAVQAAGLSKASLGKKVNGLLKQLEADTKSAADSTVISGSLKATSAGLTGLLLKVKDQHLIPLVKGLAQELSDAGDAGSSAAPPPPAAVAPSGDGAPTDQLITSLLKAASIPPANATRLDRNVAATFSAKSDIGLQLLDSFQPGLRGVLAGALAKAQTTSDSGIKVYALRAKAAVFGHNAPLKPTGLDDNKVMQTVEWTARDMGLSEELTPPPNHKKQGPTGSVVFLDASYEKISAGGWILIDSSAVDLNGQAVFDVTAPQPLIARVNQVQAAVARAAYGISGKSTRIGLAAPDDLSRPMPWIEVDGTQSAGIRTHALRAAEGAAGNDFQIIRRTAVYAQSEALPLAEEPLFDPVCDGVGEPIELDGLYDGLQSGRWLIVSGERADIPGVTGVPAGELVMLAGVSHRLKTALLTPSAKLESDLPGDRIHTFLHLAGQMAYCYKRASMVIYGNVAKATHGETRSEVLGNGDGSQPFQQFALKQKPLTFVSAGTPQGADSTLEVYVNNIAWHETDTLAGTGAKDRKFVTRTADDDTTVVRFGNGRQGARLPTGVGNVTAIYRNGLGQPGNVDAGQISLLQTRPLNVKAVTNPLRASGGADRDTRDQARRNAPLAVMALDRLVSVQDYADFARTFAGIGKASSARLSDGQRDLVHVTVAGAEDIPIDRSSDLYANLVQALRVNGDPYLPLQVTLRRLRFLVISANLKILPDYLWEPVVAAVRSALVDAFSFDRRNLGQPVFQSEVISLIQGVAGVSYVDLQILDSVAEDTPDGWTAPTQLNDVITASLDRRNPTPVNIPDDSILPAELVYLAPAIPDTLILNEVKA